MQTLPLLWVRRLHIGAPQQIVYTHSIEIRQLMKNRNRNIQIAQFIVRIGRLVDIQQLRQLFLREVFIFPQVTNTQRKHINHPKLLWVKGISHIAF